MPDFRAVRRRLAGADAGHLKTVGGWPASYGSGSGYSFAPALAQRDYAALVGSLADNPVVSIALRWIRQNVAQGRIVCGEESEGEYEVVDDHPLIRSPDAGKSWANWAEGGRGLLRRPNPFDSWPAMLGGTTDCLAVDGNAYWLKARNGLDDVAELYWAPNHQVEVVAGPDVGIEGSPIIGYWFCHNRGKSWFEPTEVVHFRAGRDPYARHMGLSDLKRQVRNAAGIAAGERFTVAVLLNGHAGKVLSPKEAVGEVVQGTPDDAEMIRLARSIERGVSGENSGRITKTSLPVDVVDLGLGPNDMALREIMDRPEAYLLAALGLNALVLGLPGSVNVSTYANKGEARREAWENGVIPLQDLIADELEHQLLPDFADSPPLADCVWWDRKDVEALKENADSKVQRAVALRSCQPPLATQNEARAMVDLPDQEGGDLTPEQEAEAGMERAQAMVGGAADQGGDPQANGQDGEYAADGAANGTNGFGNGRFAGKSLDGEDDGDA
jgi:phage portal protein BeeE